MPRGFGVMMRLGFGIFGPRKPILGWELAGSGVDSVRAADLLFLRAVAESDAFKPVIDRTYPFARIVDAHAYVDSGRKKGNVVITLE